MNRARYNRAWAFLTVVGALCILGWAWQEQRERAEAAEPAGVNPDWVEGQVFAQGLPEGAFAACSRQFALGSTQRMACFTWLQERRQYPPLPARGDWDSGKTGAQCRDEVRQHFALQISDAVDMQDMHQAHLLVEREDDARRQCRNYDMARLPRVIREPAARLEGLIERLQRGEQPSSAEQDAVAQEERLAQDFPAWPEREAYLQRLIVYRELLAALPATVPASNPAAQL